MKTKLAIALAVTMQLAASTAFAETLDQGLKQLDDKKYKEAVKTFDTLFAGGNADAGFYLARMLELGIGVQKNQLSARALFLSSADKGSPKALNRVGLMYYRGEVGVLQNYEEAFKAISKAESLGDREAKFNLAELYLNGVGTDVDIPKAYELYGKASEAGHIGAMNVLGLAYKNATNVDRDYEKARSNFERSAAQGNPIGLHELATIFENGLGTGADLVKAHQYYNLASALGFGPSAASLQRIVPKMSKEQIKEAQQKASDWKPVAPAEAK